MTQLSLFDAPIVPVVPAATSAKHASPSLGRVAEERATTRGGAIQGELREPGQLREPGELRELAQLIHQGRVASQPMPGENLARVGDLAKLVLQRHDLVATRRQRRREALVSEA